MVPMRTRRSSPPKYALALSIGYGLLTGAYIVLSSQLAADASRSVAELERIETIKGVAFVVATSLMIFVGSLVALRRMEADGRELLRRERALVAAEGRVSAGLIASSVAHDASNVLVTVLAEIDELEGRPPLAGPDALERLRVAVRRLIELNRRLASASRLGVAHELRETDLGLLAEESVDALRAHAHVRGCTLTVRRDPGLIVRTNPLLVHQILTNLVLNAAEATQARGRVDVRVRREGDDVVLEVHDDGPGVVPDRRAGIFDALRTDKVDGNGLGLFSVKACATVLGGRVEVTGSELGGALFRVRHPAQPG